MFHSTEKLNYFTWEEIRIIFFMACIVRDFWEPEITLWIHSSKEKEMEQNFLEILYCFLNSQVQIVLILPFWPPPEFWEFRVSPPELLPGLLRQGLPGCALPVHPLQSPALGVLCSAIISQHLRILIRTSLTLCQVQVLKCPLIPETLQCGNQTQLDTVPLCFSQQSPLWVTASSWNFDGGQWSPLIYHWHRATKITAAQEDKEEYFEALMQSWELFHSKNLLYSVAFNQIFPFLFLIAGVLVYRGSSERVRSSFPLKNCSTCSQFWDNLN